MQIGDPIPGYYVGMPFNGYPGHRIPLTAEEEAEREQLVIEQAEREAAEEAQAKTQAAARQSALEKLSALGLTVEEISAAFGITPE